MDKFGWGRCKMMDAGMKKDRCRVSGYVHRLRVDIFAERSTHTGDMACDGENDKS